MLTQTLTQPINLVELPDARPSFPDFIRDQTEVNREYWLAATEDSPLFPRKYTKIEKKGNEKRISEQLDWFAAGIERVPIDKSGREIFTEAAGQRLKVLGMNVLGLTHDQMSILEKEGLITLAKDFFRQARKFDPDITMEDIFQASRNVWTAGYLQVLLGLDVKLTPAIFAYSMLYPVTDNFLDDARHSTQEKVEFNQRFCDWLKGSYDEPRNKIEVQVQQLVRMIEGQFPREQYSQVYDALLAIHCAQDASVRIPKLNAYSGNVDILGVTLAKGGTSVLPDGILAAGELNPPQMEAIFNYGVFAQFMDDQEDVENDLKEQALTVFSQAAIIGKLDRTMNRLFSFATNALKGMEIFTNSRSKPLIELSLKGIDLLLIDAIQRTEKYYSRGYLREIETNFPVRFSYMKELRKRIERKNLSLERVIAPFLAETV